MAAFTRQQNGVVTEIAQPAKPKSSLSCLLQEVCWPDVKDGFQSDLDIARPLSLLTSSFIDLYQCNLQVSLLCCGYNPTLPVFILLLQVFQIWPLGAPLGGFLCFEQCLPSFLSTLYFLTTEDVPASCFFPASLLWSALSLKSPGSFYWRKARLWVLSRFTAAGVSLLLELLSRQS